MAALRNFELEAIQLLAAHALSIEQLDAIAAVEEPTRYEYTGCGYFVTVAHPSLPTEAQVLDDPYVAGYIGETECGFVAFLGDGELILECHPAFGPDIPENVRDLPVKVGIEPSSVIDLR
ncbi:hypothetical protein ACFWZ3_15750 [Frateuria sp. GZRR35]|uniref:hypothetical protein n=1 Tax=Frateuria sp. GZRR35 TaxID=3351536 RepID=UPI003EDBA257